jgi:hypothetical protein
MKRPPEKVLDAALFYVARFDWVVFPVRPGTKKSYKSAKYSGGRRWGATNNPRIIERDFRRWPRANLGIPTGLENGFWVLEADTKKGHAVDGIAELRKLERKYGRLPKTLMAISPSGSLHYYFRWPKRGLVVVNSASKVAPGVDVRGEGGMVLAPPSVKKGVGVYKWLNWGTRGADAPKWLLDLVVRKPRPVASSGKKLNAVAVDDDDVDLIMAALRVTSSDNYQVWFENGCALHFELGDAGFEIFRAWSATSTKYNAAECIAKWRECSKPELNFKLGTILHHANEESRSWRGVYEAGRLAETYSLIRKYQHHG